MSPLAKQLHWLIAIRLVVITSVVLPFFLIQIAAARRPARGGGRAACGRAAHRPVRHPAGGRPRAGGRHPAPLPDRRAHLPRDPRLHRPAPGRPRTLPAARLRPVLRRPGAGHRAGLLLRRHREPVLDPLPGGDRGRHHPAQGALDRRRHPLVRALRRAADLALPGLDPAVERVTARPGRGHHPPHGLQPRGPPLRLLRGVAAHLVPGRERGPRRAGAGGQGRGPGGPGGQVPGRDPVDHQRPGHHRPRRLHHQHATGPPARSCAGTRRI